ncbi:MAG: flagellar hook-length control protein FliK, partial [Firmicutes bacterium]|nr:flagellar hook-length control protein FliK [Bacillota bacterium]
MTEVLFGFKPLGESRDTGDSGKPAQTGISAGISETDFNSILANLVGGLPDGTRNGLGLTAAYGGMLAGTFFALPFQKAISGPWAENSLVQAAGRMPELSLPVLEPGRRLGALAGGVPAIGRAPFGPENVEPAVVEGLGVSLTSTKVEEVGVDFRPQVLHSNPQANLHSVPLTASNIAVNAEDVLPLEFAPVDQNRSKCSDSDILPWGSDLVKISMGKILKADEGCQPLKAGLVRLPGSSGQDDLESTPVEAPGESNLAVESSGVDPSLSRPVLQVSPGGNVVTPASATVSEGLTKIPGTPAFSITHQIPRDNNTIMPENNKLSEESLTTSSAPASSAVPGHDVPPSGRSAAAVVVEADGGKTPPGGNLAAPAAAEAEKVLPRDNNMPVPKNPTSNNNSQEAEKVLPRNNNMPGSPGPVECQVLCGKGTVTPEAVQAAGDSPGSFVAVWRASSPERQTWLGENAKTSEAPLEVFGKSPGAPALLSNSSGHRLPVEGSLVKTPSVQADRTYNHDAFSGEELSKASQQIVGQVFKSPEPAPAHLNLSITERVSLAELAGQLTREIVSRSTGLVRHGDSVRMELRLDPPELGSVAVRLVLTSDELKVHFFTSDNAVKDVLTSAVPELRFELGRMGLNLGEAY